jgi:D-alanyl-D-alanine carboxypeptidase
MSRRRRQMRRQRQLIGLFASACVLVLMIVIAVATLKGCGSKDSKSADTNSGSVTASETGNSGSSGSAESQSSVQSSENSTAQSDITASNQSNEGSSVTANGFKIEQIDGVTYVDGVLIANKTYSLPSTFIPTNPEVPVTEARSTTSLDKDLMTAWRKLQSAASANGLNIYISSGYRSYQYQVQVYNNYVAKDGKAMADTYSSRPGNSEHQTGLCFDLNSIDDSFANTAEGKWVNDNCYKYGFCIRFPKGKDAYTGYQYESWHLRYVGVELATKLYNNGDWLSLEEYFGITSEYAD